VKTAKKVDISFRIFSFKHCVILYIYIYIYIVEFVGDVRVLRDQKEKKIIT